METSQDIKDRIYVEWLNLVVRNTGLPEPIQVETQGWDRHNSQVFFCVDCNDKNAQSLHESYRSGKHVGIYWLTSAPFGHEIVYAPKVCINQITIKSLEALPSILGIRSTKKNEYFGNLLTPRGWKYPLLLIESS
jgi:hypothetical protein